MAMSENAKIVYGAVKENDWQLTAGDIAVMTGLTKKTVDGVVTSAFQKKGLMVRTETEVELPDGTHKKVKLISLTDAGKEIDVNAEA